MVEHLKDLGTWPRQATDLLGQTVISTRRNWRPRAARVMSQEQWPE